MRNKLTSGIAALALLAVAGFWLTSNDTDDPDQRTVVITVDFSPVPAKAYVQMFVWVNAEPVPGNLRSSKSPWVYRVSVSPGTPVVVRATRSTEGTLTCLMQVIGKSGFQDTEDGRHAVQCKVYA